MRKTDTEEEGLLSPWPEASSWSLAERLRYAAGRAQLTSEVLAERLGVTGGAVRRWWTGTNEPKLATLLSYARAVPCSVFWLVTGQYREELPERFWRFALAFADLVADGLDPASAVEEVTGMMLTPKEARRLSRAAEGMVALLFFHSGGAWSLLSAAEKVEVLRKIESLAAANQQRRASRRSPVPSAGVGPSPAVAAERGEG